MTIVRERDAKALKIDIEAKKNRKAKLRKGLGKLNDAISYIERKIRKLDSEIEELEITYIHRLSGEMSDKEKAAIRQTEARNSRSLNEFWDVVECR